MSIQWGPKTTNSPFQACLCFEILSGPYAGQQLSAWLYFGEKSYQRSLDALRACGFSGDDIDKFSNQRPENEVSIVVEHEVDDKGKTRAKVKWVNKPGTGNGFVFKERLPANDLRSFSARLKGKLKATPAYEGKKAERQPATAPAESEEVGGWSGQDQGDPDPTAGTREPGADDLPF